MSKHTTDGSLYELGEGDEGFDMGLQFMLDVETRVKGESPYYFHNRERADLFVKIHGICLVEDATLIKRRKQRCDNDTKPPKTN